MRRRTPASEKAIKQLPSHWNLHIPMKVVVPPYEFTSCHGDVRRMCRSRADLEFRVWGAPFEGAGGGGGGENWFICIQSDYRGTLVPQKFIIKKQSTIRSG
jgi:hypothetical protein